MNTEPNLSVREASAADPARLDSFRTYSMVVYALFAAGLFVGGLSTIVGLIMAYIKRREMDGTIYAQHMGQLIRTFWISLALGILGFITVFIYIGPVILFCTGIWYIYRIVRGFIWMNDRKGMW